MIDKSARYDIMITDEQEQLNLDFILPKMDEKMIHGTVWDDSDTPKKISDAVVMVFMPGPTYYESDPNDIRCIDYIIPDSNGEFVAGPFKLNTTVILKIFKTNYNKTNLYYEMPEEFAYINGELSKIKHSNSESKEVEAIK